MHFLLCIGATKRQLEVVQIKMANSSLLDVKYSGVDMALIISDLQCCLIHGERVTMRE